MKRYIVVPLLLISTLIFAACAPVTAPSETASMPAAQSEMPETEMMDIVETAVDNGSFTTLVAAVTEAGLVETLQSEGPFTVFAPTDEAFANLPEGTVESLLADPEGALTDVLLYHVVSGKVMAADVMGMDGQMVPTVGGGELAISIMDGKVMINDAEVIIADVETSNGVIHAIDTVLVPDSMMTTQEMPEAAMPEMDMMDIVDTAVDNGNFTTLVAAVTEAGLVETLQSEGPFTVFAPTDEAFANLPEGTVESLLADPEGALTDVLLYHVVSGKVMAADVMGMDGQMVPTVGGGELAISIVDGKVMINDAEVIIADVETSNGVIHVIDTVLVPGAE